MTLSTGRALIVEDDPDCVFILQRLLDPWALQIETTASGAAAAEHLLRDDWDLVILDVRLPKNEGLELLDFVARRRADLTSRSLVLTGFPSIGRSFSDLPVVDKGDLVALGSHFLRILGRPAPRVKEDGR